VDISPEALDIAKENSQRLQLASPVDFCRGDFCDLSSCRGSDVETAASLVSCGDGSNGDGSESRVSGVDLLVSEGESASSEVDRPIVLLEESAGNRRSNDAATNEDASEIAGNNDDVSKMPNPFRAMEETRRSGIHHETGTLQLMGPFDIILCNPPYSAVREGSRLSVACREHEPSLALFSPGGPLGAYRDIAIMLKKHLKSQLRSPNNDGEGFDDVSARGCNFILKNGGHLVIEVGCGQDTSVRAIFNKLIPCLSFQNDVKDHKGITRCLVFRFKAE
jgi:methylase of polypeptide subunit release factors